MKKIKCSNVLLMLLITAASACAGIAFAGCKTSAHEPAPSPSPDAGRAEDVISLIQALPEADAFGASHIPDLEKAMEEYNGLSLSEKDKVDYSKVENLLKVPVYLDDSTKDYIPECSSLFALNPYLTGKTVTSVTLNGVRLLAGQYSVNGNTVVIGENYLKNCIPSVAEIEISTNVSATYSYRVYAGMRGDEVLFINSANKNTANTALNPNVGEKLAFSVSKDEGFIYAVYFSYTEKSLNYSFTEGRRYNLYFDFAVPEEWRNVSVPVYFEGIGGKLCTVDFLDGEPIVSDPTQDAGKRVSLSYLGGGVYRFYSAFEAESDRLSLVIGVDGPSTVLKLDNLCLYPVCGAPVLHDKEYCYDTADASDCEIAVNANGGEITGVSVDGAPIEFTYNKGVIGVSSSAVSALALNEPHELVIANLYGSAKASLKVFNGLPVAVGESVKHYSAGDGAVSFEADLKGKTFRELRLNGGAVEKNAYSFDGRTLTFTKDYLDTLYSDNVFEMVFTDSGATVEFTIQTSYVYKSTFRTGVSDADMTFAPDGTGKVIYEGGKFWAHYSNPVGGTVFTLNANTFSFEEDKTYEITYNMKFGALHSNNWWSPVWLKGCHDVLYIKTTGNNLLTQDGIYPAGNPLDTDYSFRHNGEYYEVSIIFTARSKGLSKPNALEFASWDGAADVYYSDFSIAEYSEKVDVMLIGSDLLSEGYWGTYKSDISLYEAVNASKIGSDINYWLNEAGKLAINYSPRKIVLSVGENDLYSGKSAGEVISAYKGLIEKIREIYPSSRLYVLSMIKTVKHADKNAAVAEINGALKAYSVEAGFKFVDITANLENSDGTPVQALYLSDGIHIARNHYGKISSEILSGCALDGSLDALFIGDSYMSVAYWHSYEKDMGDINSVNLGVSGTTTLYWREKVASLAENYRASTIVVHIGVNDIDDNGVDSATATARIKALINDLHAAFPDARIEWLTISPNNMFASINHLYLPVNADMKAFAQDNFWFGVIDVAADFTGPDGKYLSQYYLAEGMHLNTAGYEIFVREIRNALGV